MQNDDYNNLNEKIKLANEYIKNKKYDAAKEVLNNYINEVKKYYKSEDSINYSFKNLTEFYIFVNTFSSRKKIRWINLMCDKAYMLLGYIAVEEKKYDDSLNYLNESLKYNPININSFFEMVETYKMMGNFDKMKETLDNIYDYLYDETSLAKYYRSLGFYYIEKEEYDIAFALYLISLEYEYNEFALSEMIYIRKILNNKEYILTKKEAVDLLVRYGINIGIKKEKLSLLKSLSMDKNMNKNNLAYVKNLKESIKILSKVIK